MSILSTSKVSIYKMQEHPPQSAFTKKKKKKVKGIYRSLKKNFFFKSKTLTFNSTMTEQKVWVFPSMVLGLWGQNVKEFNKLKS